MNDQEQSPSEPRDLPITGAINLMAKSIVDVVPVEATHDTAVSPFENANFVKTAPNLEDMIPIAESRTSRIKYLVEDSHISSDRMPSSPTAIIETTEGDGIVGLWDFLDRLDEDIDAMHIDEARVTELLADRSGEKRLYGYAPFDKPKDTTGIKTWLHEKVRSLKLMSFLGSEEFEEATAGLAQYWKAYLEEDKNRIIVLPRISKHKSDGFVLEKILEHYTDEELEAFRGRIAPKITDPVLVPAKVKIVLLDDWMMSGDQINNKLSGLRIGENFDPDERNIAMGLTEVNLLIASDEHLQHGYSNGPKIQHIPVKAYYRAPISIESGELESTDTFTEYNSRISGFHSSADVHFSLTINNMLRILDASLPEDIPRRSMPPLTNIVRTYREQATSDRLADFLENTNSSNRL